MFKLLQAYLSRSVQLGLVSHVRRPGSDFLKPHANGCHSDAQPAKREGKETS
jgi:hypothetical protein